MTLIVLTGYIERVAVLQGRFRLRELLRYVCFLLNKIHFLLKTRRKNMGYLNQFKNFDPLQSDFHPWKFPAKSYYSWRFPEGASIVYRARSILRGRTAAEIVDIATDATRIIETFFEAEKESAIDSIRSDGRYDLLELDEGRVTGLTEEAFEHYDVRTPESTPDLEALQEGIDNFYDPSYMEIKNLKQYEYFAVLALWRSADCVEEFNTVFDLSQMKRIERESQRFDVNDAIRVGGFLIEAMEAVCYAERLLQVERTQQKYEQEIEKLKTTPRPISDEETARLRAEAFRQLEEDAKAKRSEQAKENSRRRHAENNQIKKEVLAMWEKNPYQFSSAEKAGSFYADVLAKRGINREHRTVVGWIRSRAKDLDIRFR